MTRILVYPEELHGLGGQMHQAAGELRAVSARLTSALGMLDWESRLQAGVDGEAAGARSMAERLAAEAEGLARFLERKAQEFADADAQGSRDIAGLAGVVAGVARAVTPLGLLGAVWHKVDRWVNLGAILFPPMSLPRLLTDPSWIQRIAPGVGAVPSEIAPAASAPTPEAPAAGVPAVQGPAQTLEEFRQKVQAVAKTYPRMEQWTDLIWKISKEQGVPAEVIAAVMIQESGGDAHAGKSQTAGQGLMQIEFSAHKSNIPGATEDQQRAWIREPENNVRFGAKLLKEHLDKYIGKYGPEEGLRRGLQAYNYGSGAATWCDENAADQGGWDKAVEKYNREHPTYGNPKYWEQAMGHYHEAMDAHGAATPHPLQPVPIYVGNDDAVIAPVQVYDGASPAESTTDLNVAITVKAPVGSQPAHRSTDGYDNVINQFAVDHNPRYVPRDTSGDGEPDTFCNIFVSDVTQAMGAPIPHWVDIQGVPSMEGRGSELSADATVHWLSDHGAQYGWKEVSPEEAQQVANLGKPAVAAWDSHSSEAGHVAVVRPGNFDPDRGPTIAQAGGHNYNRTTVKQGFGARRMDQVRYFIHE